MSFIPINNSKQVVRHFKSITHVRQRGDVRLLSGNLIPLASHFNEIKKPSSQPVISSTGKTVALVIGCEYVQYANQGIMDQLPGCFNDTITVNDILTKRLQVPSSNISIMRDDLDPSSSLYPNVANIESQFSNLVARANKGEFTTLWLTYSGHGSQVRATNSGEPSNKNSVIVPADFIDNGFITDNYIATQFLAKLPSNLNVNILFDSCHSGTAVDLPYTYSSPKSLAIKENSNNIVANVCYISGCRDNQTSESIVMDDTTGEFPSTGSDVAKDTLIELGDDIKSLQALVNSFGKRKVMVQSKPGTRELIWRGALTYAFETVMLSYSISPVVKVTLDVIFAAIQAFLSKNGYTQSPEVSLSKKTNLNQVKYPL